VRCRAGGCAPFSPRTWRGRRGPHTCSRNRRLRLVLARLERCNRIRRIRVVWAACVGCLESRVLVSGGFDVSESNAADRTVPYFCNLLQINPSFEIAEKKCNKKKNSPTEQQTYALPPGSSLATPEATPPPPKETASTTPCSPRRRRRMPSADGGGGVPPFFSIFLCPSILYHHSRFVSIRSGRTFTTSRESASSRRHARVAVRCWTRPSACVF
jgi:hypothetical protein